MTQQPATLLSSCKSANRLFPTGVTVVTADHENGPCGLTVNAFSSVSMDPPMVLVCVNRTAQSHDRLYAADVIGVNVLAHDQSALAMNFATSGGDKFAAVDWHASPGGAPILDGASAAFEIRPVERVSAATHTIFIGEITAIEVDSQRAALVYVGGEFRSLSAVAA